MNFSLQGIPGSDPGAGRARASSQKTDALASAAGAFRALVDVLANRADASNGGAASSNTSEAVPHDGFANLTDDNTAPVDSPDAATNTTAASALAALNAAWAGAPFSASSEEGDGGGTGDGSRPTGDDTRPAGASQKSSSRSEDAGVTVAVWIADALAPAAIGASNGQGTAGHDDADDTPDASGGNADARATFGATGAAEDRDAGSGTDAFGADARTAAAFDAALDDAAQATREVAAKDLVAAMAAARAAQHAARQGATSSDTANAASDVARSSSQTDSLASLVNAATASRGEAVVASAPPVVVPHLMTSGGSTSFSSLMTGLSNGAPSSNANALPDTTAAQIVQTLRITAMGNGGEARITLDPGQFGELRVSIRVEQGQVVARMEADSPVVREWLQANQNVLRHQLAEQNLTLSRLEVSEPSEPNSAPRD